MQRHTKDWRWWTTGIWGPTRILAILVGFGLARPAVAAAPVVEFSRTSSTHFDSVRVRLNHPNAGSGIRYTLDGTEPVLTSPLYTEPLVIRGTVQVRAAAPTPSGMGPIRSETFLQLTTAPGHAQTFTSTLPILVLSTWKPVGINYFRSMTGHVSLYEPAGGTARIGGIPAFSSLVEFLFPIDIDGDAFPAPGGIIAVLLQLRDEFGDPDTRPLLGFRPASQWLLLPPSGFNPTLINTHLSMELGRQIGVPTLKTRPVEVYLNRGGPLTTNQWLGLYLMMELPSAASSATGGRPPEAAVDDPIGISGDYLFATALPQGTEVGFNSGGGSHRFIEPSEDELKTSARKDQLGYLKGYFAGLDRVLDPAHPQFRDPENGYRAYLDVTNWIDCHVLETLSGNVNAFRLSSYFLKPRAGKLQRAIFALHERAWESKDDPRDDNPRKWDAGGGLFRAPFWSQIFQDPDTWQLWLDRWSLHRAGPLSLTNIYGVIDRMTNEVGRVQPREARRWTETAPRASYSNEIWIVKRWISNRVEWIDRQFARSPSIHPPGGAVPSGALITLNLAESVGAGENSLIYFTRDGSDPRPSAGATTGRVELYTGPITISTNTRIVARVRESGRGQAGTPQSTPWSAPVSATFVVEHPRLIVTEVMHHPEPPPPFVTLAASDFEFVELWNPTEKPMSLVGFRLEGSVRYRFTSQSGRTQLGAGERVVLVSNRDAFGMRYPGVQSIAGEYEGGLDGSERRIRIRGPMEELVFEAGYTGDGNPMAEGVGFSVVPRNEVALGARAEAVSANDWRLSARVGGSPGRSDPEPDAVRMPVLNEVVLGAAGYVELYNPHSAPVFLSGWITDDLSVPQKRRLSAARIIPASGYLTIPATELVGNGPSVPLSTLGGELCLLAAAADGSLSGVHERLRYVPGPAETAHGRRVMTDGSVLGLPLTKATPRATNAAFRIGPVVFGEVQLAPSPAARAAGFDDSFIELRNLSDLVVPLELPDSGGVTLAIDGPVEFHARRGATLPPGGVLVVTAFDPLSDPYSRDSFLALHGRVRGGAIEFAGPWRRPDVPGTGMLRLAWAARLNSEPPDTFQTRELVELVPLDAIRSSLVLDGRPEAGLVRRIPVGLADEAGSWIVAPSTPGEVDADVDGLDDEWEAANQLNPNSGSGDDGAGGDPDADGFSNELEAYNRTDPRDPADHLRAVPLPGSGPGELVLTWAAPAGRAYAVEQLVSGGAGTWEERASGVMGADSRGVVRMAVATSSAVFFRVLLR